MELFGLLMFGIVQTTCYVLPAHFHWFKGLHSVSRIKLLRQSLFAGVTGGVLRILLDSFMHEEMNPFWPFVDGNVLAGTISVAMLHIGLAVSGFFGLIFWLLLRES